MVSMYINIVLHHISIKYVPIRFALLSDCLYNIIQIKSNQIYCRRILIIIYILHWQKIENTSLAATMVRWFEGGVNDEESNLFCACHLGGVNQGLLPMTISEEETNSFCACHLLKCYVGQGQWSIAGFWYIVNDARHRNKETSLSATGITRCSACVNLGNMHNKQYGN
jgi:hypothetical protein